MDKLGYTGQIKAGERDYFVSSETETASQIMDRLARGQKAAREVLEVLLTKADEYKIKPGAIVAELDHLTKLKKG